MAMATRPATSSTSLKTCRRSAGEEAHSEKRVGEVGLGHDQERPDEEQQEAPEEEAVGEARSLDVQDLALEEDVLQQVGDPLFPLVEAVQRLALLIDVEPLHAGPDQQAEGGEGEEVHGNENHGPVADIPVKFACCFHVLLPL